jgi:hypothetical protein
MVAAFPEWLPSDQPFVRAKADDRKWGIRATCLGTQSGHLAEAWRYRRSAGFSGLLSAHYGL